MDRPLIVILILLFVLGCSGEVVTPTGTPPPTTPATPTQPTGSIYHVSVSGNDSNPGTLNLPWQTIRKAVEIATAGDLVYIRAGQYDGIKNGWVFQNTGTELKPITLANYPGEQVIFKISSVTQKDHQIFRCSINPQNPANWQTPKADYIHIIGTDVTPRTLPNGVESGKGLVILGAEGEQSAGIYASDCDYWEIAGMDFVETADAIFTEKNNWHTTEEHSADYWYVHDNRVYNYYRESGMQFNGNFNRIENNEIYKVSNRLDTPYGCQMLNLLGNNNIVRGNILSRMGSTAVCLGILFEWDIADANTVEQNTIDDVPIGISFQGGDDNAIRNNKIIASPGTTGAGIYIASYDNQIEWPCNDYAGSGSTVEAIIPPNDPSHPDYPYYYNPRNCHSMKNQITGNTILGFHIPWTMHPVIEDSNVFLDNITSKP